MNNNITAYLLYFSITIYIIRWVGRMFHQNGYVFILRLFKGDKKQADTINNLLLLAYYLFNTGYALLKLSDWDNILTTAQLIDSTSHYVGLLILILAITHYGNMLLVYLLSRRQSSRITT